MDQSSEMPGLVRNPGYCLKTSSRGIRLPASDPRYGHDMVAIGVEKDMMHLHMSGLELLIRIVT